jgi:hypothetical protein
MKNYFRVQQKGYTFDQMKNFNSVDGGDGENEGLAVSSAPNGIDGGSKFGGAWEAMNDNDDLVILNGQVVCRIYDGYRLIPTAEVARFTIAQWKTMLADGSAYDYEN